MNEQEQARNWRESRMRLSREELATLTGYSASAIYLLETENRTSSAAWKRYKHVCLAVQILTQHKHTIEEWKWGAP